MKSKPTVISLFAGGGGSSLGYKMAGYKELLAIEWNESAAETFSANFKNVPIWVEDIHNITAAKIMQFCNIEKGELDVLDGSPPCQGFSLSGKRIVMDKRNDLFFEYIRLLKNIQPKIFIMENVTGMIIGKMKGRYNQIMQALSNENYNVKCKLMSAENFNVPQRRRRLIFIGIRKDFNIVPDFPKPNSELINPEDALKNIIPKTFGSHTISAKKIYSKIAPGQGGFINNNKKTYYNYVKVHPRKPAPTVLKSLCYCGPGYYHWSENRSMSIEELKALCSYPQSFILKGSFAEQWACLGNSVMPNFMKAIALHIKNYLIDI